MNDATKEQDPLQAAIGRKGILFFGCRSVKGKTTYRKRTAD